MKDLLTFVTKSIITNKKALVIREQPRVDETLVYTIEVAPEDMGKVIGKNGKTIRAIRNLLACRAIKENKRVYLELADS